MTELDARRGSGDAMERADVRRQGSALSTSSVAVTFQYIHGIRSVMYTSKTQNTCGLINTDHLGVRMSVKHQGGLKCRCTQQRGLHGDKTKGRHSWIAYYSQKLSLARFHSQFACWATSWSTSGSGKSNPFPQDVAELEKVAA